MPRIRTLKPEAPQHPKIGKLSDRAFRLWIVLVTQADDEGRLLCDPDQLRLLAFGYQPTKPITDALQEIITQRLAVVYPNGHYQVCQLHDWQDHQKINRPTPSKLPPYNDSLNTHGALTEDSVSTHGSLTGDRIGSDLRGSEGKGVGAELQASVSPHGALSESSLNRLSEDLSGWLLATRNLTPLADPKHCAYWKALEKAYDSYSWLYFEEEIAKADAWIEANPQRKPTPRGLRRFMRSWFERAVEHGRRHAQAQGATGRR